MIKGLEYFSCDKRLRELKLFRLEKRRLGAGCESHQHVQIPEGYHKQDAARTFSDVPSDWTRGNRQTEIQEVPSEHQETLSHWDGD